MAPGTRWRGGVNLVSIIRIIRVSAFILPPGKAQGGRPPPMSIWNSGAWSNSCSGPLCSCTQLLWVYSQLPQQVQYAQPKLGMKGKLTQGPYKEMVKQPPWVSHSSPSIRKPRRSLSISPATHLLFLLSEMPCVGPTPRAKDALNSSIMKLLHAGLGQGFCSQPVAWRHFSI